MRKNRELLYNTGFILVIGSLVDGSGTGTSWTFYAVDDLDWSHKQERPRRLLMTARHANPAIK
jgi:hypothetical protein